MCTHYSNMRKGGSFTYCRHLHSLGETKNAYKVYGISKRLYILTILNYKGFSADVPRYDWFLSTYQPKLAVELWNL